MSVYIYDAVRSPRGKGRPGGSLAGVPPVQLVVQLVRALERRLGQPVVHATDHLSLGCVTQVLIRDSQRPPLMGHDQAFEALPGGVEIAALDQRPKLDRQPGVVRQRERDSSSSGRRAREPL